MKHTSWKRIGLTGAVIALVSAAGTGAQNLPDGFGLETMVAGPFIGYPVGFTFLPDGRTLIVEKETGNVRIAAVGAGTSVVAATIPGVAGDGERGLLGIAVDPAWPARPYIYLMATYTGGWMRVPRDAWGPRQSESSFNSTSPTRASTSGGNWKKCGGRQRYSTETIVAFSTSQSSPDLRVRFRGRRRIVV